METLKQKAEALLDRSQMVVLTSVNAAGYPRPVPMSKIKSEGISAVWMATGANSVKTKDFLANPKAGLCVFREGPPTRTMCWLSSYPTMPHSGSTDNLFTGKYKQLRDAACYPPVRANAGGGLLYDLTFFGEAPVTI